MKVGMAEVLVVGGVSFLLGVMFGPQFSQLTHRIGLPSDQELGKTVQSTFYPKTPIPPARKRGYY